MVNFSQLLVKTQYTPWSDHYLNYILLKETLTHHNGNHDDDSDGSVSSSTFRSTTNSNFLNLLYIETEKVSFFVLQQMGSITFELGTCRQQLLLLIQSSSGNNYDASLIDEVESNYVEIGKHLLRLIQFVDLNVTGFRKILKKHDKICRANLSLSYLTLHPSDMMSSRRRRARYFDEDLNWIAAGNQLMQPLLQDDTITAVTVAYESGVEELQKIQYEYHHKLERRSCTTLPDLLRSDAFEEIKPPDTKTQRSRNKIKSSSSYADLRGIIVDQGPSSSPLNNNTSTSKKYSSSVATTEQPLQLLLQIHAARGRLHQTNEFVQLLAARMLVPLPTSDEGDDGAIDEQDLLNPQQHHHQEASRDKCDRFSNTLNLLSTFLYMTNYYIVAPTSATYADKVGSDSSIASIIIGMTAFAALGSTILYSYWTSYSYKSALIFASTCSAFGNLLYAFGLPFQSLTLVMLGRFMNGFGSARSINRRYIADSFSVGERTNASAAFVTASALGMAAGPCLASILHLATAKSSSVYWKAENAPGWFMFVVWTVFLICLILYFHDPPRKRQQPKLQQEQRQEEEDINHEKKPLLGGQQQNLVALSTANEPSLKDEDAPMCCNIPVIITLIVYMVLKMILEAVISSESNLTALYFGWEGNIMGVHMTLLALLILPVNFAVAVLARTYFDRELIIGLLLSLLVGCLVIYQYQDEIEDYSLAQYLIGSAVLFVGASALEAPNMSLLSKVLPRKWSKGIINVGLLATEAGTLGRVIGDALLATMGSDGLETMLNDAFGAFSFIVLVVVSLCALCYRHLEPYETDN